MKKNWVVGKEQPAARDLRKMLVAECVTAANPRAVNLRAEAAWRSACFQVHLWPEEGGAVGPRSWASLADDLARFHLVEAMRRKARVGGYFANCGVAAAAHSLGSAADWLTAGLPCLDIYAFQSRLVRCLMQIASR